MRVEWQNHESRKYARLWRSSMEKKKKLVALGNPAVERLVGRIRALDPQEASAKAKAAMEKDAILIVAARHAARVVISADDTARRLFEKHADRLGLTLNEPRSSGLRWLNPITDRDEIERLLQGRWPYI
jgi:cell division septum initiation protein DivIVA